MLTDKENKLVDTLVDSFVNPVFERIKRELDEMIKQCNEAGKRNKEILSKYNVIHS